MAKANIHPAYFATKVICTTCSNEFMSGSTKGKEIRVDSCSNCHPFYTGKQSFGSAKGRVERFLNKANKQSETIEKKEDKKTKSNQSKVLSLDSFKIESEKK